MDLILYLSIHNFVIFDILDKNKECSKKNIITITTLLKNNIIKNMC